MSYSINTIALQLFSYISYEHRSGFVGPQCYNATISGPTAAIAVRSDLLRAAGINNRPCRSYRCRPISFPSALSYLGKNLPMHFEFYRRHILGLSDTTDYAARTLSVVLCHATITHTTNTAVVTHNIKHNILTHIGMLTCCNRSVSSRAISGSMCMCNRPGPFLSQEATELGPGFMSTVLRLCLDQLHEWLDR